MRLKRKRPLLISITAGSLLTSSIQINTETFKSTQKHLKLNHSWYDAYSVEAVSVQEKVGRKEKEERSDKGVNVLGCVPKQMLSISAVYILYINRLSGCSLATFHYLFKIWTCDLKYCVENKNLWNFEIAKHTRFANRKLKKGTEIKQDNQSSKANDILARILVVVCFGTLINHAENRLCSWQSVLTG